MDKFKNKVLDRINNRQKRFIRFTVPVIGYNNEHLDMKNYNGPLTWIWIQDTQEYMVHFPHNFAIISLKTMGIITANWAVDYDPVGGLTLGNFSLKPRSDVFNEDDTVGHCDPDCVNVNKSCGIGRYEIEEFLLHVTNKSKYDIKNLCLQAREESLFNSVKEEYFPHHAVPNLIYYWKFLKLFYGRRPYFGYRVNKRDYILYYCFSQKDGCQVKMLLNKFYIIPIIALLLFLYSPLLIHYFPSTPLNDVIGAEMFPSYKTPYYFGNCLKCILCYYPCHPWWQRIRRLVVLTLLTYTSFELHHFSANLAGYIFLFMIICFIIASVIPESFSMHIKPDYPTKFLFWELPLGLLKKDDTIIEYQKLAHIMQERIYLLVDKRFWVFLRGKLNQLVNSNDECKVRILPIIAVTPIILLTCLYWFIPLPFFYIEFIRSIWRGGEVLDIKSGTFYIVSSFIFTCFLNYAMVIVLYWCYALSEISMFTFMGGAMTPHMAFQYFLLLASVIAAIYALVRNFHELNEQIMDQIINILNDQDVFETFAQEVTNCSNGEVVLHSEKEGRIKKIKAEVTSKNTDHILFKNDTITKFINLKMYEEVVEDYRPIRRRVFFIVVKIILMLAYGLVAFWIKNVFHLEDKVGNIFNLISNVAIAFVPGALQFLAYKSHFGKRKSDILKRQIYQAMVHYIKNLDN